MYFLDSDFGSMIEIEISFKLICFIQNALALGNSMILFKKERDE